MTLSALSCITKFREQYEQISEMLKSTTKKDWETSEKKVNDRIKAINAKVQEILKETSKNDRNPNESDFDILRDDALELATEISTWELVQQKVEDNLAKIEEKDLYHRIGRTVKWALWGFAGAGWLAAGITRNVKDESGDVDKSLVWVAGILTLIGGFYSESENSWQQKLIKAATFLESMETLNKRKYLIKQAKGHSDLLKLFQKCTRDEKLGKRNIEKLCKRLLVLRKQFKI
jgi:hypothetical protein